MSHKQRTWKKSTMKNSLSLDQMKTMKLSTLRGDVMATLRSMKPNFMTGKEGNLYEIVAVPSDMLEECIEARMEAEGCTKTEAEREGRVDALNEWVAMNTVDFYNEVQLLYSLAAAYHEDNYKGSNQGFPPGYNYRFPGKDVLNGSEYVNAVMSWISDQLESNEVFPESDDDPFPTNFLEVHMSKIYQRMCRIFAIMFTKCLKSYTDIDALKALNFCWKHFYYFVNRYDLIDKKEFAAFKQPSLKPVMNLDDLVVQYTKDKASAKKG